MISLINKIFGPRTERVNHNIHGTGTGTRKKPYIPSGGVDFDVAAQVAYDMAQSKRSHRSFFQHNGRAFSVDSTEKSVTYSGTVPGQSEPTGPGLREQGSMLARNATRRLRQE